MGRGSRARCDGAHWRVEGSDARTDEEKRKLDVAFVSSDSRYQDYLRFKKQFTQSTGDIAVVFTAEDLAEPATLRAVQDFAVDAQLVDGVADVHSIFALRISGWRRCTSDIPEPLPQQPQLSQILDDLRKSPSGLGRLVSVDRTMTVVIVTLEHPDARCRRSTLCWPI